MKLVLTVVIIVFFHPVIAQKNVYLKISPRVNDSDLQIGTNFYDLYGRVTNLDYFNYYLSGLRITHDGGHDLDLSDTVFLVKSDDYILYLGYINVSVIESISFSIGVPPNLNTISGAGAIDISTYPSGHPLSFQDPSMHWGWSAGYFFVVSGGSSDSDADGLPDASFEMNNLGDNNYVNVTLPIIQTNIGTDQIDINVNCNVDVWFKGIPLSSVGIMHGTNGYNADMMANVAAELVFTQPLTAGIIMESATIGSLTYADDKLKWNGVLKSALLQIFDSNGKLIMQESHVTPNGELSFFDANSGFYLVKIISTEGIEINRLKFSR